MKKTLYFTLSGAIIGILAITWAAPYVISWWFTPPIEMGFNCKFPIEWALARFQWAQLLGLVLGALFGMLAAIAFRSKKQGVVS